MFNRCSALYSGESLTLLAASSLLAQSPLKIGRVHAGLVDLVLLPDTQIYSDKYPGLFTLQTHWIAKNKDKYNIRYVLGLGDITDDNTDREWRHAKEAIAELDGKVPYALVAGNHDYTPHGNSVSGTSGMNKYFPPSKFQNWPTFGGVMKQGDITNSYHLFSAGGTDWIVIVLQWAPSDAAVQVGQRGAGQVSPSGRRFSSRTPICTATAPATTSPRKASRRNGTRTTYPAQGRQRRRGTVAEARPQEQLRPDVQRPRAATAACGFLVQQERPRQRRASDVGQLPDAQLGGEGYLRILGVPARRQDGPRQVVLAAVRQVSAKTPAISSASSWIGEAVGASGVAVVPAGGEPNDRATIERRH